MGTDVMKRLIVGLLAVLALLVAPSPAGAHAELASSDPTDGATLAAAPAAITFTFGEEILDQGNAVTLTDVAADTRLELGPVAVEGDTVSVTWPDSSPAGEFRAAYRVVSADGHPIDGTISFVVEQAVGTQLASPVAVPASPVAVSSGPSSASASPDPAQGDADAGLLVWVLGVGVAVLIGAGAGAWIMRRTR